MLRTVLSLLALMLVSGIGIDKAAAQVDPYVGQVAFFAFGYCPDDGNGWVPADGRVLPVSQYQALFALLGKVYGGNGTTTFAVPDLRGRSPVGTGEGPNIGTIVLAQQVGNVATTATVPPLSGSLSDASVTVEGTVKNPLGQGPFGTAAGTASFTLAVANLPPHTHQLYASKAANSVNDPTGNLSSTYAAGSKVYAVPANPPNIAAMSAQAVGSTGSGSAVTVNVSLPITDLNISGAPVTATGVPSGSVTTNSATIPVTTQSPALGLTACIAGSGVWPRKP